MLYEREEDKAAYLTNTYAVVSRVVAAFIHSAVHFNSSILQQSKMRSWLLVVLVVAIGTLLPNTQGKVTPLVSGLPT